MTRLAKDVSNLMAEEVLDLVFPVAVIKASGNTVYIDKSEDSGIKKGMIFNVYNPIEPRFDSHTKMSL